MLVMCLIIQCVSATSAFENIVVWYVLDMCHVWNIISQHIINIFYVRNVISRWSFIVCEVWRAILQQVFEWGVESAAAQHVLRILDVKNITAQRISDIWGEGYVRMCFYRMWCMGVVLQPCFHKQSVMHIIVLSISNMFDVWRARNQSSKCVVLGVMCYTVCLTCLMFRVSLHNTFKIFHLITSCGVVFSTYVISGVSLCDMFWSMLMAAIWLYNLFLTYLMSRWSILRISYVTSVFTHLVSGGSFYETCLTYLVSGIWF